jgi:hypothetical protein
MQQQHTTQLHSHTCQETSRLQRLRQHTFDRRKKFQHRPLQLRMLPLGITMPGFSSSSAAVSIAVQNVFLDEADA